MKIGKGLHLDLKSFYSRNRSNANNRDRIIRMGLDSLTTHHLLTVSGYVCTERFTLQSRRIYKPNVDISFLSTFIFFKLAIHVFKTREDGSHSSLAIFKFNWLDSFTYLAKNALYKSRCAMTPHSHLCHRSLSGFLLIIPQ